MNGASHQNGARDQSLHDPIQRLVLELARLPGIGERSAARLAFYIIKKSHGGGPSMALDLAGALSQVADEIRLCEQCQNFCTAARCRFCSDSRRDLATLCVVEAVSDLRAIEESGAFRGRYHVLHGALAPLDGVGPTELRLDTIPERVSSEGFREVIIATNADVEGDSTALYLAKLLRPSGVRVTRLASGVPMGGELEYLDQATVGRALAERRDV